MIDQIAFDTMMATKAASGWAASSAAAAWIVGLASLIMNGGGLYFIWHQLKANQVALKDAARSADAASEAAMVARYATRPWVRISIGARGRIHVVEPGRVVVNIPVSCENIGTTPAVDFFVYAVPLPARIQPGPLNDLIAEQQHPQHITGIIFPSESRSVQHQIEFPETAGEGQPGFALVVAFYRAPGSSQTHRSIEQVMIVPTDAAWADTRARGVMGIENPIT